MIIAEHFTFKANHNIAKPIFIKIINKMSYKATQAKEIYNYTNLIIKKVMLI